MMVSKKRITTFRILVCLLAALTLAPTAAAGVLADFQDVPVSGKALPFKDVSEEDWYYEALVWCSARGVLTDIPLKGHFQGDAVVTRAAFTAMLARLIEPDLSWTEEPRYSDVQPGSLGYEAISWAGSNGLPTARSTPRSC